MAEQGKRALNRFVSRRFLVDGLRFLKSKYVRKVKNGLKARKNRLTNVEQSLTE